MSSPFDYDLIVLGGGSGGIVSAVMAGGLGRRVLLIEKHRMGGECLNTGCVPSKALIHRAKIAHLIADDQLAALVGDQSRIADLKDSPAIGALRSAIRAGALEYVRDSIAGVREADATEALLREMGVEIRIGDARFVDEKAILLEGRRLRSRAFILATGSRPARPEIEGLEAAGYVTNTELFDLTAPPESLLIIGGGPVGVEMAQAFQRLGTRVTLVQRGPQILRRDDEELTAQLLQILRDEGVDVRLNTVPVRVTASDGATERAGRADGRPPGATRRPDAYAPEGRGNVAEGATPGTVKHVTLRGPDGAEAEVTVAEILVAVGRCPNAEGLNLEAARVSYDDRRVIVDARMRTTGPRVWAVGDVTGSYLFSHVAEYEAKTAVWNILFPCQKRASFRVAPWATFTDPELASVGMTEDQLQENGIPYTVLRQSFAQNDRAITDGEGVGLVKVLVKPGIRGQILGVHILGPRAGELIQEWALAMQRKNGVAALADLIHVYPTLSMANQHAAQRWYQQMGESRRLRFVLDLFFRLRGFAPAEGKSHRPLR